MRTHFMFFMFVIAMSFITSPIHADNSFVGAGKCKACHRKAKDGEQFKIWSKGPHAKAFKSLATPKAKELAAVVGVSADPQKAKECLVCHTPSKYDGSGNERSKKMFGKKFKMENGVGCEACHGAGGKYWKKKIMKKIAKEGGPLKSETAKKMGLIRPDEKLCRTCHAPQVVIAGVTYRNPTYKDFIYMERVKEIAHPRPKK